MTAPGSGSRRLRALGALALVAACGPQPPSSAACQAGLLPGDLVLTEVFADFKATPGATGADAGKEWIELYNPTRQPVELEGVTLTHSRPDGSKAATHVLTRGTVAPGAYFTLGNAAGDRVPAYVDYGYGSDLGDLFNTDGGKLALACDDTELDGAGYASIVEGHARALSAALLPEYTLNDAPASWCQANDSEFEAGNFGTPGAANDCQPIVAGQCSDGGTMRDAVAPGPGDLVITEVMPSPAKVADATGEWFEARAERDVDLNGVGLDRAGDPSKPDLLASPACLRVRAGSYLVFARSADPALNGGLPAVAGTFRFSLVTGTPTLGDVAIVAGTTIVDAVTWTRSTSSAALQLDRDLVDPTANDTERNFCTATQRYGKGDLGSPGRENADCPALPPAGMCDDHGAFRAIARPSMGQLVISELLANPANVAGASDAQREWFEIANTGTTAFDLNELSIGRIGTAGAPVQSARCVSVAARGFAVLARSTDPAANGLLPSVEATFRFGLVDTGGDIQISDGASVLDAVRWTSVTSGVSRQLDPAHLSAADNDVATQFCPSTAPYGDATNLGSPGAANAPCK